MSLSGYAASRVMSAPGIEKHWSVIAIFIGCLIVSVMRSWLLLVIGKAVKNVYLDKVVTCYQ